MVQLHMYHPDGLNTKAASLKQLPLWEHGQYVHSKARGGGEEPGTAPPPAHGSTRGHILLMTSSNTGIAKNALKLDFTLTGSFTGFVHNMCC